MEILNLLWRNLKWRFQNPISIALTIIQPLLWLLLYSVFAGPSMQGLPGGNYTAFLLPGILVLVTLSCCSSSGYLNFIMKSQGSFYRLLIAPVRRSSIVLGQMFEAACLSLIEVVILFGLASLLSVRVASGVPGLLLMLPLFFLTAFLMSGLCYAISLRLPNEAVYETLMSLIILVIFFTSSALFPVEPLAGGLKMVVWLNPFTHIINCLRSLILEPAIHWQNLCSVTAGFVLLGCGSFALALRALKSECQQ